MVLRCYISPACNRLSRRLYTTTLLNGNDCVVNTRRYQCQSIPTSFHINHISQINNDHTTIIQRPVTSLLFGRAKKDLRPWHDPMFMNDSTPEEIEKWLLSLLQSARINADTNGIITNNNNNNNHKAIVYFDKSFNIDATAYLRVMESYNRSKTSSSPQKMEYWLGMNERHYADAVDMFYERFGDQSSSHTADHKYDKAAAIVQSLQPTVEHYNSLIEAWGKDKDLHSVVRSRRWLSRLEDDANDNDYTYTNIRLPLHPNTRSYDLYLHSCSRGLGKKEHIHHERAQECEEILNYMLASDTPVWPTTESFNYVLRAYTRCRKDVNVAERVMNIVLIMEQITKEIILAEENGKHIRKDYWKQNVAANTKTYTLAIDAWIIKASLKAEKWRSEQLQRNNRMKQISKGKEIDQQHTTCSKDDGTKEMEKASTILKYISDLSSLGLADVNATVVGYNTLLSGWARLSNELRLDIPFKSERLLHDMIGLAEQGDVHATPDVITYNCIIKAWGRTKQPNSADRCEFWLRKMIDANHNSLEENCIPSPNVATYNLCIDAHVALGDAASAERLLNEMKEGNGLVSPNSESYSKVIRAFVSEELHSQHSSGESIEKAWGLLQELIERERQEESNFGTAPDLFNTILKTAARSKAHRENVLNVAQSTFCAMRASRFRLTFQSYTWLLEVLLKVLSSANDDERRANLITEVFQQCCKDGLLSRAFVDRLIDGPFYNTGWTKQESVRLCTELWGDVFPPAWTRELKDKSHLPLTIEQKKIQRDKPKPGGRLRKYIRR